MEPLGFGWCCERARRESYIMINTHLHKTQVVPVVLVAPVVLLVLVDLVVLG